MNRKTFIESTGATCKNWNWSWSFVNNEDKFVVFGVWEDNFKSDLSLILDPSWKKSRKGRLQNGYTQAVEHIDLVRHKGYKLKIYKMIKDHNYEDDSESKPSKIKKFDPNLLDRQLKRINKKWYASDEMADIYIPEEVTEDSMFEGAIKEVKVNSYERNKAARKKCIEKYGYKCSVCSFDFESNYGEIGKEFIHVHHKIPLADIRKEYKLNPTEDLVPVCPNCHAMLHRTKPALTIEELRNQFKVDS